MPQVTYQFRLRFRVAATLDAKFAKIRLPEAVVSRPVVLAAAKAEQSIENAHWLVALSQGYSTEQEARTNGQSLKDTLLLTGAVRSIGIDVGLDNASSSFAQSLKDTFQKEHNVILRNNIFGLDVFEDGEFTTLNFEGTAKALVQTNVFLEAIPELASLAHFMDERSRTSARLMNDSLFPMTPETCLIILMTSIESLWPQPRASKSIVALGKSLLAHLEMLNGSESDKDDVRRKVEAINSVPISSFCRQKISELLDESRAKQFTQLYAARSRFVHNGKGRSTLHPEVDIARQLALDTLMAELRRRSEGKGICQKGVPK